MKKDKFYYGMISGLVAGTVQNTLNLTIFILGVTSLRYLDWTSIMIYGHKPVTILDGLFALINQLGINATIGIIFAYALPLLGFEHYLLKGMVMGIGAFQFTYFITFLFKIPDLIIIPTYTAISNFTTSAIFGIILALLVKKWVYSSVK
ncbi:hypothetical protein [Desulfosporosinus nitroreducens]|uniref:hypothetical protein n=1 Tax=Desulfosporosinus nitroreducens TaxID=2018668 RepID=UPI00207D5CBD|nr:hypothetical protein [Desulfosporosinus nitroreducens]MCO1602423.1 hypothetical protein [Desulfosporosinus nitroreducens]